jgi:hypothetical protein
MISDFGFRIADWARRHRSIVYFPSSILVFALFIGCINKPQNPAATQPATAVDLATTQPSYWLTQPAAAQVKANDFDALWQACKSTARGYLFALDREDYRGGVITTKPMVSKQWFEPWRPDTGTLAGMMENSTATMRRTLRFEIDRGDDGSFTITPKVLVERQTLLERRISGTAQYRSVFVGPGAPARYSVNLEDGSELDLPVKYWTPVGRDTEMEKHVAQRLRADLSREEAPAPTATAELPGSLGYDGEIVALGTSGTVYINLGEADKVVPGMTFEVHDAKASAPPLEKFGAENAGSKGWIEVQTVSRASSACKVIKAKGAAIAQGDRVFNFIFDRAKQNHFVIAGDFEDRDTVAGLIWRWNGVVDTRIDGKTNYVIAGAAPADAAARKLFEHALLLARQRGIAVIDDAKFDQLIRYYDPLRR